MYIHYTKLNDIKFSVIIPVFNTEKYLKQCIESVLNQTYKNFEVILINDGSTDSSKYICDYYADKDRRINVLHQSNKGHTLARRKGIEQATGDYLLFLDSDDYWDNNLLESVYKCICEFNCDIVIFKYRRVSNGKVIGEQNQLFEDKMVFENYNKELLFKKIITSSSLNNLSTKVVKRSVIDNQDYNQYQDMKNGEDLLQSLPWFQSANKIVYMNEVFYNYRLVPTSITNTFNINRVNDFTTVRTIVLKYLEKLGYNTEQNLYLFYRFYLEVFNNYINDLIDSKLSKQRKIETLNFLTKNNLYLDSLKYVRPSDIIFYKRIQLSMFKKEHFNVLIFYIKLLRFLKRFIKRTNIKRLLLKRK